METGNIIHMFWRMCVLLRLYGNGECTIMHLLCHACMGRYGNSWSFVMSIEYYSNELLVVSLDSRGTQGNVGKTLCSN